MTAEYIIDVYIWGNTTREDLANDLEVRAIDPYFQNLGTNHSAITIDMDLQATVSLDQALGELIYIAIDGTPEVTFQIEDASNELVTFLRVAKEDESDSYRLFVDRTLALAGSYKVNAEV